MPITRKQYENGDFKKRSIVGEGDYVLDFLKKNDKAYLPIEIAKAVKRSDSMIRQKLRVLLKKRLIERTVPYYIAVKKVSKKKVSVKKKTKKKR